MAFLYALKPTPLQKISIMKYLKIRIFTLFLLVASINSIAQISDNNMSPVEFQKNTTGVANIQVLDVRTAEEYKNGHIKNSLQADYRDKTEFARRISYIDKSKPVYVYCLSSGRSNSAAKDMTDMGFKKVVVLSGGLNAWRMADLPVEATSKEPEMSPAEFGTAINNGKTVLVDFGGKWCAPCRLMEPVLESLQKNNTGKFNLVKVDGGKDFEILKQNSILVLPVFIIYKNGKQVWRKDGLVTEKELAAAMNL